MTSGEPFWTGKTVLVTGGSSFLGSYLTDQLIVRGANVHVVDDLSSGRRENLRGYLSNGKLEFQHADLREPGIARAAMVRKVLDRMLTER